MVLLKFFYNKTGQSLSIQSPNMKQNIWRHDGLMAAGRHVCWLSLSVLSCHPAPTRGAVHLDLLPVPDCQFISSKPLKNSHHVFQIARVQRHPRAQPQRQKQALDEILRNRRTEIRCRSGVPIRWWVLLNSAFIYNLSGFWRSFCLCRFRGVHRFIFSVWIRRWADMQFDRVRLSGLHVNEGFGVPSQRWRYEMVDVLGGLRVLLYRGILFRLHRWLVPSLLVDKGQWVQGHLVFICSIIHR